MKKIVVLLALMLPLPAAFAAGPPCSWGTTGPGLINFGTYAGSGTAAANTSFTLRCRPSSATSIIAISRGQNSATFTPRYMKHLTLPDLLPYNLYTTAGGPVIWGDGINGGSTVSFFNPDPGNKDFVGTIYALMPAIGSPLSVDVAAGTYEDRVTVTNTADGVLINNVDVIVRIVIAADCTVSAFTLDFLTYDPIDTHRLVPRDVDAPLDIFCTRGTQATVSLDNGLNFATPWRRMSGPGGLLPFQLYTTAARTIIWNAANTVTLTSVSKNTTMGFRIYGRIPAAQDVGTGAYQDTIRATVTY